MDKKNIWKVIPCSILDQNFRGVKTEYEVAKNMLVTKFSHLYEYINVRIIFYIESNVSFFFYKNDTQ